MFSRPSVCYKMKCQQCVCYLSKGHDALSEEAVQHGRNIQQKVARGAVRLLSRFGLDESEDDVLVSTSASSKDNRMKN